MIVLQNVTKSFGSTKVLNGISLKIQPGEFLCITGPSGAGKSTLLSLLIGADSPTSGSVMVDDVDLLTVPADALQIFRRKVGMVFQEYKLLRNRTVEENIAFPLEVCGVPDAVIDRRVSQLLSKMDLMQRRNALPDELSGGEKARTAIARALAHEPLIVLADEPTGNLDREQAKNVMALFREIHDEGTTVIVATHDPTILEHAGARILRLVQGMIELEPSVRRTKKFVRVSDETVAATPLPEPEPQEEIVPIAPVVHRAKKKLPAKKSVRSTVRRKIKITAIHSDID